MPVESDFDVVICGGGLAGLTLARQIRLELPELTVLLIDRLTSPLPEAAFKVGESSIELGTYYLGQVLQLDGYFREKHLPKLGLRFFIGNAKGPLTERSETGPSLFPPVPSYQIDRGRLENDLRKLVQEMGVTLLEGTMVEDIELASGEAHHILQCRKKGEGEGFAMTAHWLVDASGRRRFLQTRLGLERENRHRASAAWWRYPGRIDVEKMGTADGKKWQHKLVEERYFSTNHLMGRGYWVWLIPLGSGATSMGIVTDEEIHPQNTYGKSYTQALDWLSVNEPKLWEFIRDEPPMDFLSLKGYSYGAKQIFSHKRWSCVGEAGFFIDPLYSVGSDFIAVTNTITVEMIRRERAGELSERMAADYNRLVLENLYPICLDNYQGMYSTFGHAQIFTPKLTWDTAIYWAWMYQLYVQRLLIQPTVDVFILGARYKELNARVQRLFKDWSENAPPHALYLMGDMTRMRLMMLLHLDLAARRDPAQTLAIARKNLDRFEELALVLFWQAVKECYPDQPALKTKPWVNAWRMILDPEKWADSGIFEPETEQRPLQLMMDNFTGIFRPQGIRDKLLYEFPYQMLHWGHGFVYYHIVPLIRKLIYVNKAAMWARMGLIRDYPARKARRHPGIN